MILQSYARKGCRVNLLFVSLNVGNLWSQTGGLFGGKKKKNLKLFIHKKQNNQLLITDLFNKESMSLF